MAWKDDGDVAHDLDVLSGICSVPGKVKSYSSRSRGIFLEHMPKSLENEEKRLEKSESISYVELPPCLGRGQKLEILKLKNSVGCRESEVHKQLRVICGLSYSNELIEETFRGNSTNKGNCSNMEQFQNAEESESEVVKDTENTSGEQFLENSSNTATQFTNDTQSEKVIEKKKRPCRRYRNVALENLTKLKNSCATCTEKKRDEGVCEC